MELRGEFLNLWIIFVNGFDVFWINRGKYFL